MNSEILNQFKHSCDIFADVIANDAEYSEAVRNHPTVVENLKPLLEPGEEFRYIVGYPNYVVTNFGKVINIKTLKILKQTRFCTGSRKRTNVVANNTYKRNKVTLCAHGIAKCFYVHQLVGKYFLPEPIGIDNPVIDHIDHDTNNNHYTNLRWRSLSDNSGDTHNTKYNDLSLEQLIELRDSVRLEYGYKSKEYKNIKSLISYYRKKNSDGTQGD